MYASSSIPAPSASQWFSNPVTGERMTFRQRTDGQCDTILDLEVTPGGGIARHFHDAFSETFTCLTGVIHVEVGTRVVALRPGESATVPVSAAHRWFNDSDEVATARVTIAPGHAGMERALIFLYGLARDGLLRRGGVPSSLLHLALITDLSNTRAGGVLGLVKPVFARLAARARRLGLERDLLARYGA